jgi:membrane protease YdiL (CAAX protease family)
MQDTPSEVVVANLAFILFWLLVVGLTLLFGRRGRRRWGFREQMMAQLKPALAIASVFLIGTFLGGRGLFNPYVIAVFCQALIGLALAREVPTYEPLPVTESIGRRKRPLRSVGLFLGISLLLVIPTVVIGSLGLSIGAGIFGETLRTDEAMGTFEENPIAIFFLLLSGAGIAEETTYRLVLLSAFWRWTGRRWLAISVSSALFGAYHLSPLDGLYRTFWRFPASQFLASTLIGVVLGYVYVKRGYETAVLGHTFGDWIPFLLFG